MKRTYVFPGQGSQFVGMGKVLAETFPEACQTFEAVDDALARKLSALIFEGPEADLNMTENTQPALMAVSMAVVNVLKGQGVDLAKTGVYVAGHSLGEYSALTAAGTLRIEDTAKLLKLRGESMQKAVPVGIGAMAAILGLTMPEVQAIALEAAGAEVCAAANDNSDGQVVVSGHKQAVVRAVALATSRGAKRAVMLPVSAPFHCALMAPAAEAMKEALAQTVFAPPSLPVVANVTAQAESDPDRLRTLLVEQITGTVRWRESVLWMAAQGVTEIVELGAGKVLSGLVRRIDKNIVCRNVETPQDIDVLLEQIKTS
ncbi:MAG: ACP S-malonyltransferase [Alphaproteobacteria bacterium]|nr:ACP S-malonyltransferase [Alphaproteobacteria bacterium]MBP7758532.1 ACP S-malonyltransferase [Alphaproteobacteria bacterium]MBP7761965.1 ACP S-malonyltransferase [Alphaproteobacteria bacterium]MBP7905543.1 ACP S-malonyltransferase [Alphaproteobacteria bacterium]